MQDRGAGSAVASSEARNVSVTVLFVVLAAVVYFLVPVPGRMRDSSWVVLFCSGLVVLGLLITLRIRNLVHATEGARLRGLVMLLSCVVLFFSWADEALAAIPGQFAELHTKTDALYFSVSTLATVGFGDVHAAGQVARAAMILQMLFNLLFLGAAVAVVSGVLRRRVQRSRQLLGLEDSPPGSGTPSAAPGDQGGAA